MTDKPDEDWVSPEVVAKWMASAHPLDHTPAAHPVLSNNCRQCAEAGARCFECIVRGERIHEFLEESGLRAKMDRIFEEYRGGSMGLKDIVDD